MEDFIVFAIIIGIFGGAWYYIDLQEKAFKAKLKALQDDYQDALNDLKGETTKEHRVRALEAGRALAEFCRDKNKVAIFDEVALQNDLQAYGAEEN